MGSSNFDDDAMSVSSREPVIPPVRAATNNFSLSYASSSKVHDRNVATCVIQKARGNDD